MIRVLVAIAGSTALVCTAAALTDVPRDIGVDDNFVDTIDKPLRRIIDRAYNGARPGRSTQSNRLSNAGVKRAETHSGIASLRATLQRAASGTRRLGQRHSRESVQAEANSSTTDVAEAVENA